jgi:hypothetical protein
MKRFDFVQIKFAILSFQKFRCLKFLNLLIMKNRFLATNFISTILLLTSLATSCRSSLSKEEILINQLEATFEDNRNMIKNQSEQSIQSLRSKLQDQMTRDHALKWLDRALKIQAETKTILSALEEKIKTLDEPESEQKLSILINNFKEKIKQIDLQITNQFGSRINDVMLIAYKTKDNKLASQFSFGDFSEFQKKSITENVIVKIELLESEILAYCDVNSDAMVENYNKFSTIIGSSTTHLKQGDWMTITGGIGEFVTSVKANMKVDNRLLTANKNGFIEYKFKAIENVGKHSKLVTIEFHYCPTINRTKSTVSADR